MSYLSVNLRHLMKFKPLFTENLLKNNLQPYSN